MESQEKIDKKFIIASNYKKIREFRSKTQDFVVKALEAAIPDNESIKQNVSAWENVKSNPGKKFIDHLSTILLIPKETFYMDTLTDEYLKKNFSMENGTDAKDSISSHGKDPNQMFRDLVESNSEYRLVPKVILDNYEIIPKSELEHKAQIVREALAAKNYAIAQLEKEVAELRAGRIVLQPEKTQ